VEKHRNGPFQQHAKWQWWARYVVADPVIPATPEMEIRRIKVQGHPGQKVSETSSQTISLAWWHKPVILAMWEAVGKRTLVWGQPWTKTQNPA
jgi:hypothetical protein